jgi:endonuclease/exonuclease/phosphatase (EEP) superfamily protein YafD
MESQNHLSRYTLPFLGVARMRVNEEVLAMRQKEIRSPLLIAGDINTWTRLRTHMLNYAQLEGQERISR